MTDPRTENPHEHLPVHLVRLDGVELHLPRLAGHETAPAFAQTSGSRGESAGRGSRYPDAAADRTAAAGEAGGMKRYARRYWPAAVLALFIYGAGYLMTGDLVLAVFVGGGLAAFLALVAVVATYWFRHDDLRDEVRRIEGAQKALERRYVKFAEWADDVDAEHARQRGSLRERLHAIEQHLGLRHLRAIPKQDRNEA